eukprot:8322499-Pyramimonas_sp.AAC.1
MGTGEGLFMKGKHRPGASSADEGDGTRLRLAMASARPRGLQLEASLCRAREPASVARAPGRSAR